MIIRRSRISKNMPKNYHKILIIKLKKGKNQRISYLTGIKKNIHQIQSLINKMIKTFSLKQKIITLKKLSTKNYLLWLVKELSNYQRHKILIDSCPLV